MTTRDSQLTEHLNQYVDASVATGHYGDASEMLREALRLLLQKDQEHQAKVDLLRSAVQKGVDQINQGEGIVLNGQAERSQYFDELEQRVAAKTSKRNAHRTRQ